MYIVTFQYVYEYVGHHFQLGPSEHTLNYVQKNLKEYPKFCVYWIGPLIIEVFTADVETMKRLLQRPEGVY